MDGKHYIENAFKKTIREMTFNEWHNKRTRKWTINLPKK
jgi:hypothetical protein